MIFNYAALPEGDTLLALDSKQPSFQFDDGMSYFAAYRLPANTGNLAISIASHEYTIGGSASLRC
ncbi:hypothetical protein R5M74_00240 [Aeromonas hydrophila]|nr:hypothetical protein R5M74_00240 [Aeromonas hydrophila]